MLVFLHRGASFALNSYRNDFETGESA